MTITPTAPVTGRPAGTVDVAGEPSLSGGADFLQALTASLVTAPAARVGLDAADGVTVPSRETWRSDPGDRDAAAADRDPARDVDSRPAVSPRRSAGGTTRARDRDDCSRRGGTGQGSKHCVRIAESRRVA